jgi:hypothetical protein
LFTPQFLQYLFFGAEMASIDAVNDFFPIAWSLSVDEWFYVLSRPFLLGAGTHWLWCRPCGGHFHSSVLGLKLVGAALVSDWDAVARRLVLFRLDAIAFGFLLYFLISNVPSFTSRRAVLATSSGCVDLGTQPLLMKSHIL